MRQSKLGIIGHFAEEKNLTNGQTVKTKNLYDGLYNANIYKEITKIDTY